MGVIVLGGSFPSNRGGLLSGLLSYRGNGPMGIIVLVGSRPQGSCPTGVLVLWGYCPQGSCP